MPDISFACPSCGQSLEAPDAILGQTVECPACKTQFVIPAPEANPHLIESAAKPSQQEASAPALDVPPTTSTPQLASEAPEQLDAPTMTEPEGAAADAHAQQSGGFGRNLLAAGRAAAAEAKRGGQLASITAQIEKLRRLDLAHAYRAVGKQAYDSQTQPESYKAQFDEIAALDAQIAEKEAALSAVPTASIAEKAKAKGRSAKMQAEAQLLKHKRNAQLEKIGKAITTVGAPPDTLRAVVQAVLDVQQKIADLSSTRTQLAENTTNAKQVRSSARVLATLLTPSGARARYCHQPSSVSNTSTESRSVSLKLVGIVAVIFPIASVLVSALAGWIGELYPFSNFTDDWYVSLCIGVTTGLFAMWALLFVTGWTSRVSALRPIAAWCLWGLLSEKLGVWAMIIPLVGCLVYLRDLNPLVTGYRAFVCAAGLILPGPLMLYMLVGREMNVAIVIALVVALSFPGLLALRAFSTRLQTIAPAEAPPSGPSSEMIIQCLKKYSGPSPVWAGIAVALLAVVVVGTYRDSKRYEAEGLEFAWRLLSTGGASREPYATPGGTSAGTAVRATSTPRLDTSIPGGARSQGSPQACWKCSGVGTFPCNWCRGTGKDLKTYNPDRPQVIAALCNHCKGTGRLGCDQCNGRGVR